MLSTFWATMLKAKSKKPDLIAAGPGAGKTFELARRIEVVLPTLATNKYLAAITFTNEASNSIREYLSRRTEIGSNVFIGTFHSFANKFIVGPFSRHFDSLPDDRHFCEVDVGALVSKRAARDGRKLTPKQRVIHKKALVTALVKKGVVPYDEIIRVSMELLDNAQVRALVCGRLQRLFIDEFQDTDTRHLAIFDSIRKGGVTEIEAVGDPEQYIYSFTYQGRSKAPPFEKIPFFRFRDKASLSEMRNNRRSCQEIVTFNNQFRTDLVQESLVGGRGEPRVFFIEGTCLEGMVLIFKRLYQRLPSDQRARGRLQQLFLGHGKATFDQVADCFEIRRFSSAKHHGTPLHAALSILALCRGSTQNRAREDLNIDELTWRKYGVMFLKDLRDGNIFSTADLSNRWLSLLQLTQLAGDVEPIDSAIEKLRVSLLTEAHPKDASWSSSIHQAKGLEAVAILAVTSGISELHKWCMTNSAQRGSDKRDTCRLGYVAFSRAMELLCLACLTPLDSASRSLLVGLGVKIVTKESAISLEEGNEQLR